MSFAASPRRNCSPRRSVHGREPRLGEKEMTKYPEGRQHRRRSPSFWRVQSSTRVGYPKQRSAVFATSWSCPNPHARDRDILTRVPTRGRSGKKAATSRSADTRRAGCRGAEEHPRRLQEPHPFNPFHLSKQTVIFPGGGGVPGRMRETRRWRIWRTTYGGPDQGELWQGDETAWSGNPPKPGPQNGAQFPRHHRADHDEGDNDADLRQTGRGGAMR